MHVQLEEEKGKNRETQGKKRRTEAKTHRGEKTGNSFHAEKDAVSTGNSKKTQKEEYARCDKAGTRGK